MPLPKQSAKEYPLNSQQLPLLERETTDTYCMVSPF